MATTAKRAEREKADRAILIERGYEYLKREDRFGETKTGWWCDDVYLGKTVRDAIEVSNG